MTLRLKSHRFYLRLWCYIQPALAFAFAAYLRFGVDEARGPQVDQRFYGMVLLLNTLAWVIAVEHYDLCDLEELFREYTGIRKTLSACIATYAVLLGVLFFYRQQSFSRLFFVVSATVLLFSTLFTRISLRYLLRRRGARRRAVPVLVVGTDDYAKQTAEKLSRMPFAKSQVVAHLQIPGQNVAVTDVPVYELTDLGNGTMPSFDEVIIAVQPSRLCSLSEIVSRIELLCVPIRAILDLGDLPLVRDRIFQFGDVQMLDLSSSPLETPTYFCLKRIFDIVFSTAMIIVSTPVMLLIAIAVKVTSPGGIWLRQERVGLNGQRFVMYKFRTMVPSSALKSDIAWTVEGDPRRTAIGKLLRKTSLDELPQFFNVLRGDMSVVGPRPERPHFVKQFLREISHYDSRHRLKVGITGWAQVNGWRGDTSIHKRFECDLYYLQNWSFWLDLRIIVLTALSCMFGRNAY